MDSATSSTFTDVSAEAEASYGGLFYSGSASGGFDKSQGNSSLTQQGSKLKISFKVRKVLIQRPWLVPELFHYPTLGIRGLSKFSWSCGELDCKENKGSFPLLPTAMVVAKDVEISADSFSSTAIKAFEKMQSHASFKVCGCTIHCICLSVIA